MEILKFSLVILAVTILVLVVCWRRRWKKVVAEAERAKEERETMFKNQREMLSMLKSLSRSFNTQRESESVMEQSLHRLSEGIQKQDQRQMTAERERLVVLIAKLKAENERLKGRLQRFVEEKEYQDSQRRT